MGAGSGKQYDVVRRIARGGMGEVLLARQRGIGGFAKEVVIKQIHRNYAEDPDFINMFLQEARIAALLDHPNIVQIFELGRHGKSYFIVMEYVEGPSLSRLMRALRGPLPVPLALQVASGVAQGLHYAHTRTQAGEPMHLVHRDISPPNILISSAGNVKITDFGIAKVRWSVVHTQAGAVKGKYFYISPEQARGEAVDHRSDIYSLGLVLYEMTTGKRAYTCETETELLRAAATGAVTPPAAAAPNYPRDLEQVVLRTLAVDPAARYSDCNELHEELTTLMARRKELFSPAKLGQFVVRTMVAASSPPEEPEPSGDTEVDAETGEATNVDSLNELQTIILDRVEDATEGETDGAPTALDGDAGAALALAAEKTQVPARPNEDGEPVEPQLPVPGDSVEDDEPTRLDTRLPALEQPLATIPTPTPTSSAPATPIRVTPLHLAALFGIVAVTALITWCIVGPDKSEKTPAAQPAAVVDAAPRDSAAPIDVARPDLRRPTRRDAARPDAARPGTARPDVARPDAAAPRDRPTRPVRHRRPRWTVKQMVTVKLSTEPPAQVYHRGRLLGRTPLKARLPAQSLTLRFRDRALGLDTTRTLSPGGTAVAARYVFRQGEVRFSVPPGRVVKLDGKTLGRSPIPPLRVYEGLHRVEVLEGQGRRPRTVRRTVQVRPGQTTRVSISSP